MGLRRTLMDTSKSGTFSNISAMPPSQVLQPRTLGETGLAESFLCELACKHLSEAVGLDLTGLVERLALAGAVVEEILNLLRKDGRVEIRSVDPVKRYDLTERGRSSARDALARSGYIGVAPYPVSAYCALLQEQTIHHGRIGAPEMQEAFGTVVIAQDIVDQLGLALNSRRAMMIYGPSG